MVVASILAWVAVVAVAVDLLPPLPPAVVLAELASSTATSGSDSDSDSGAGGGSGSDGTIRWR